MTTSWNPLLLSERITKNYTSCKIKHRPSSSFVRGLTRSVGWASRMATECLPPSPSFTVCDIFLWGWQSRKCPDQKQNISWTGTTYLKYFCCCSSWFLKEKLSALSRLQKCAKCWGVCWNPTLNDISWALNSSDIIYNCIYHYVKRCSHITWSICCHAVDFQFNDSYIRATDGTKPHFSFHINSPSLYWRHCWSYRKCSSEI